MNMSKSEKLSKMAENYVNVAQFISVKKENIKETEFSYVRGIEKNSIKDTKEAIKKLIENASSGSVNIRSYSLESTKGNRFEMGKKNVKEILAIIAENADNGLDSIINESIDVNDGGVSGVIIGNLMEFSPGDTPRCVEKDGVCSLPKGIAEHILYKVYQRVLDIPAYLKDKRVEFSIHPFGEGLYGNNTIVWEYEDVSAEVKKSKIFTDANAGIEIKYPNNFSRFIGDKVFGLLLADSLMLLVPKTTVINRSVRLFTFGRSIDGRDIWTRTAPKEKAAGKYTTVKGWIDPFKLLSDEDPKGENIPSVIIQDGVRHKYSGSALIFQNKEIIEGVVGRGDNFMIGESEKSDIPKGVISIIKRDAV